MRTALDTFRNMKYRCYNSNDTRYNSYGGKGITICNKWLKNPVSFATWSEQNGWSPGKHIHRKNNSKGYSPNNCEWLSPNQHKKIHSKNKIFVITTNINKGDKCKCKKCGYVWESRIDKPKACPVCKQYSWQKEKEVKG